MTTSLSTETARITDLIKREQFGEVESTWAEAVEKAPEETDTFLELAEKLYKLGFGEKAGNLLEQLVVKLVEREKLDDAVRIVATVARIAPRNGRLREMADQVFPARFGSLEGFESLVERAEAESKGGAPAFVSTLHDLLKFQPEDYIFHDAGWGLGQVQEIDVAADVIRVDFDGKPGHEVKLGAAAKFFRKLPWDNILVQRAANLDELKQRCNDDPAAVVHMVLKSHGNSTNLKRLKAELVPEVISAKSWSKWWQGARKALTKHEYIRIGTGVNASIERLVTAMTHEDETREQMESARRLTDKLAVLRRYLKESDAGEARRTLLEEVAGHMVEQATTPAARLVVAFLFDDLRRAEPDFSVEAPCAPAEMVKNADELIELLPQMQDGDYQVRALDLHREVDEAVWADTFRRAFMLDIALWDALAGRLMDADKDDLLVSALDEVSADPSVYPAHFLWLARRGLLGSKLPASLDLPPPDKLFERLIWTTNKTLTRVERGENALKDTLVSLRTTVAERQGRLLSAALEGASEEQASHLLHCVRHCRALSEVHNAMLRDVITKTFPALMVREDRRHAPGVELAEEILATPVGLRKREDELKRIQEEELPAVAKQIGEALAMGDISENAELDAAREKEARLKDQAREILDELKRVRIVQPEEVDASAAGFGTKVKLLGADGVEAAYTILGRYEADLAKSTISIESPIAQGILGRGPNEEALVTTPEGSVTYKVISIEAVNIQ